LTNSQLPQHTSNCKQATNASRNSLLVSLREKHENPEKHGWDSVSSLNFLGVPPSTARLVAIILSSTLYPLLALVLIPLRHLSPCGVCAIPIASVITLFPRKRLTAVYALSPFQLSTHPSPQAERVHERRSKPCFPLSSSVPGAARWGSGNCCYFSIAKESWTFIF
jgi:hypothetical protein